MQAEWSVWNFSLVKPQSHQSIQLSDHTIIGDLASLSAFLYVREDQLHNQS